MKFSQIKSFIIFFNRGYAGYWKRIIILAIVGFIGGILEGIGINTAIPLFSFAINTTQAGTDIISRAVRFAFDFLHLPFSVRYLILFIVILFILRSLMLLLGSYIKIRISNDYEEETKNSLVATSLKAQWPFLLREKLGHLDNLIMTNVRYGGRFLENLSDMVINGTSLVVYLVVALFISAPTTLFVFVVGVSAVFFFKPLLGRTRRFAHQVVKTNRRVVHHINENILGLKTLKVMAVEPGIIQKSKDFFRQLKLLTIKVNFLNTMSNAFIQPLGVIVVCFIFAFSYRSPNFNFVAMAAVLYLVQKIFQYFQQLQSNLQTAVECVPYIQSILDYRQNARRYAEVSHGTKDFSFNRQLEFKDVVFGYDPAKPLLINLNFTIRRGEMVGLIGPSGAGKTTITDLLLRLFEPTSGQILLDGIPNTDIDLDQWRKHIGYVSQDIFLMNDTVANNIRFYDPSITDAMVEQATKMAQIYEVVDALPNKFDTNIGERGVMLSAGQRQRIVIARALARKPHLLLLDEATSALDNESELRIQEVIEGLRGTLTVVIIAHRLSTIMNSDRLLVIEKGHIVEQGSPRELLADTGTYFYKMNHLMITPST